MNPDILAQFKEFTQAPLLIRQGALEGFVSSLTAKLNNQELGTIPMPVATYRNGMNGALLSENTMDVPTIMVIPVDSVITTNSYPEWGVLGLLGIQEMLEMAMQDDNILGVIIVGSSPGGSSSMLIETADMIVELRKYKPVGMFVSGECCSAFYYLAIVCDFVICTPKTSLIGNIGAVTYLWDNKQYLANLGMKEVAVYGDLATDKDLGVEEALAGNTKKFKDMMVNPLNEMFVNDVKAHRPQVKEVALHGAVYYSQKAVEMGMVDGTGTFDDALNRLIEMTNVTVNSNTPNSMKKITMTVNDAIASGLKMMYKEAVVEDVPADGETPAEPDPKDAEIENLKAQLASKTAELDKPVEDPKDAEIVRLKAQLAGKEAELAKRVVPGAMSAAPVVVVAETPIQNSGDITGNAVLAQLPHNAEAKEYLANYI